MSQPMTVQCCITGGGPAGMMLGYLMGRAGVETVVLEKHGDFLRDFRGDTVHPSTLDIMTELGLIDEFLKRPHSEIRDNRRRDRRGQHQGGGLSPASPARTSSWPPCRNGIS